MIKITIDVTWGHGDSPRMQAIACLEALAEKIREASGDLQLDGELVEGSSVVGKYRIEFNRG